MFCETKFLTQKNEFVEFNKETSTQSKNNIENEIALQKLNLLENKPIYRCGRQQIYCNIGNNMKYQNNNFANSFLIKQTSIEQLKNIKINSVIAENKNDEIKNEAPIWNEQCAVMLQGYKSLLNSNEVLKNLREILTQMVETNYIDWNECLPYVIEGRIYTLRDHAEFTCEIFQSEQKINNNHNAMIVITRKFGDGWIFEEFRTTLLQQLKNKNSIVVDNDFVDIEDENKLMGFDQNFFINDDINNDNTKEAFTFEAAKQMLNDAIDCSQQRDILCENLLSLRLAVNDETKIKIIYQIDNIFSELLKPIMGEDQLYDTWIIKTILEIVLKLREYGLKQQQQLISFQLICTMLLNIKQQWANVVPHPLGLSYFCPSQQIVRVCDNFKL